MNGKNYLIPQAFFSHKTFKSLSPAAKLLYVYYWNEFLFPSRPLKVDDEGRPIIRDEWKQAREFLSLATSSANTARRELLAAGLIRLSNREGYLLILRGLSKDSSIHSTLINGDRPEPLHFNISDI